MLLRVLTAFILSGFWVQAAVSQEPQDERGKAAAAHIKACKGGERVECHVAGNIYGNSDDPEDQLKGVAYYRKACDMDYGPSCSSLGYFYGKGRGVSVDLTKAASFYRKACESGEADACESANAKKLNERRKTEEDGVHAAVKLCQAGESRGCSDAASAYESGTGVKLDLAKAATYHRKTCELGQPAGCVSLALMYESGRGVPRDSEKAKSSYMKATPLYRAGCNEGHGQSCKVLGNMLESGRGGSKDVSAAISFYRKGCDLGDKGACSNVSRMESQAGHE